ncbi:MAG: hypothetical protein H6679_03270 [Epsilonproteobacteria bacterium]|nr:hypothetical protein [Campylobacterota bacterium]
MKKIKIQSLLMTVCIFFTLYANTDEKENTFESLEELLAAEKPGPRSRKKGGRTSSTSSKDKQATLKGCINVSDPTQKAPPFKVYFAGKEVNSDEEGFYSFPLNGEEIPEKIGFVITKAVDFVSDKNTVEYLQLLPEKRYRYFSLKKHGRKKFAVWSSKEKNLEKKEYTIPEQSVIVMIDPKHVAKVEDWELDASTDIIKLPVIHLTKHETEELRRLSAKSLLYALDSKPFHETIKEEKKNSSDNNKVKISLMQ